MLILMGLSVSVIMATMKFFQETVTSAQQAPSGMEENVQVANHALMDFIEAKRQKCVSQLPVSALKILFGMATAVNAVKISIM